MQFHLKGGNINTGAYILTGARGESEKYGIEKSGKEEEFGFNKKGGEKIAPEREGNMRNTKSYREIYFIF